MFFDLYISLIKGYFLGGTVYLIGQIFDNYISDESKKKLRASDEQLYLDNNIAVQKNLLIISPVFYCIIDNTLLNHEPIFSLFHFGLLILTQNIMYFFTHREMHRHPQLKSIHAFHHRFKDITLPSTGFAVSRYEFILAYIFPFLSGAFILKPTELTFLSSIGTISILNIFIHTKEFENVWWVPGLVAPKYHISHHKKGKDHYAAPLIDFDFFSEHFQKLLVHIQEEEESQT